MAYLKLPRLLQVYIAAHFVLLPILLPSVLSEGVRGGWLIWVLLVATGIAGACKLELTVLQARMSVVFAVACLALMLVGAPSAVACAALGALVTTVVRTPKPGGKITFQRQPLHRLLFNPVHCALVCCLAALAYRVVLPHVPVGWAGQVCALIVFTSVYFLANSYGIAIAIGLQQRQSPRRLWVDNFLWTSPGFFASALATAAIWGAFGVLGVWALLLVVPLYLLHQSGRMYLARLESANASLQEQVAERLRAEVALRQEREFLQAVVENAADGIIAADAVGKVIHINSTARELTGEILLLCTLPEPLVRALKGEPLHNVEVTLTSGIEERREVLVTGQPLWDAEGQPQGSVVVLHDITERKLAAEARERLIREQVARSVAEEGRRRLAFLAKAGEILASSLDYEITLSNVARLSVPYLAKTCVIDMLQEDGTLRRLAAVHDGGRAPLQHVGQYGVGGLARRHPVRLAFETARTQMGRGLPEGPSSREELDPAPWSAYLCCPLVARGSILGVISFLADESGEEFDCHQVALAEELAHRAAQAVDNARLYREVQEHDRRKDMFLAMLGHELRNPLAAMFGSLEVLRLRGAWAGVNSHALNVLARQTRHQARLVEDLLDVSRISQGRVLLRTSRVDLLSIAAQSVESVRPLIEAREHSLQLNVPSEPVWVEADPTRLEQVFVNLLNNATKYTDPGGELRFSIQIESERWAVARVRDNGIGMSADLLRRVFDVFTQAPDAQQRGDGGLGLGLSLVRGLIERHGGRVEAHSDGEGAGAELVVYLPLAAAPVILPEQVPTPERVSRGSTLRVLVVDDNRDAAEMTVEVLELWGHAAAVAHTGEAALGAVEQRMPDVVLLDIGMPGMDGYAVARELRARPDGGPRCIIAVTGYGQPGDVQRALSAGMDAHLTKPVDPEDLRRLLQGAEPPAEANEPHEPVSPFSWPQKRR
jgi:signal transduction histidine kinase/PAS domain-containing protein/ActR/RegA family two-component response regulator